MFGFHAALFLSCVFPTPPLRPPHEDRLVLTTTKSGNFSFRQAYQIVHPIRQANTVPVRLWKEIWYNRTLSPRIRIFLWKILHSALPIKGTFARRTRVQWPSCDVCGTGFDDDMHVLFHCNQARQMWFLSPLGLRTDTLPQDVVSVFSQVLDGIGSSGFADFAMLLWSYWKDRCKLVYEGKKLDVNGVLRGAKALKDTLQSAHRYCVPVQQTVQTQAAVPHFEGCYCFTDGSFHHGGQAGWAYTLHDNQSLLQYGMHSGSAFSPFQAELFALTEAVKAVNELAITHCTFYTDCEGLFKVISGQLPLDTVEWRCYQQMLDLLLLLQEHPFFVFSSLSRTFCIREHLLANLARKEGLNQLGFTYPLFRE